MTTATQTETVFLTTDDHYDGFRPICDTKPHLFGDICNAIGYMRDVASRNGLYIVDCITGERHPDLSQVVGGEFWLKDITNTTRRVIVIRETTIE